MILKCGKDFEEKLSTLLSTLEWGWQLDFMANFEARDNVNFNENTFEIFIFLILEKSVLGDLLMNLYHCDTFWKKSFPIFDHKFVPFKEIAPAQICRFTRRSLGKSCFLQLPFCLCWPEFSNSGKCFRLYGEIEMVLGDLSNCDVQPVESGWLMASRNANAIDW